MKEKYNDKNTISEKRKRKILKFLKGKLKKGHEKSNGIEFMGLCANVLTIATYCSISPAFAGYQGIKALYYISSAAIGVMGSYAIWQFFCLLGYERLRRIWNWLNEVRKRVRRYYVKQSFLIKVVIGILMTVVAVFIYNWRDTTYYTTVTEIYGIPEGVGMSLTPSEREERSDYWKIEEYRFRKRIRLTYVESYQQLDLMREYSTAYSMAFFRPSAQIIYTYKKNENKYRSYGEQYYMTARKNGFREPEKIRYYDSCGKLLLEEKNRNGNKFEILIYSSEDMPQLLNSTLLCSPGEQTIESGMTSWYIETNYNAEGMPESRRLIPRINNQYGVNGERYVFDENKRLTELCYLDIDGEPACNKDGIMLIKFQHEENGNLRSISYFSDENGIKKTEGFNNVYCEKFEYDAYGNLTERRQLGRDENWQYDDNGIYMYQYTYIDGMLEEEAFWGKGNKPLRDNRYHSRVINFKEQKNIFGREIIIILDASSSTNEIEKLETSEKYPSKNVSIPVGIDKQMADIDSKKMEKGQGVLADVDILDKQKDTENRNSNNPGKEQDCFGAREKFTRKYSSIHYKIKSQNRIVEESYRNSVGNLIANESGYAVKQFQYDTHMRVISESYLDIKTHPCYVNGGYAEVRMTYNQDNELVCVEYLDTEGGLINNNKLGYAYVTYERLEHDQGKKIISCFYDKFGELTLLPKLGYAIEERFYNERGLLDSEAYYDNTNVPICRTDYKVAKIEYSYANDGNCIKVWYQDVNGQPANRCDVGYAVKYREYKNGKLMKEYYEGYQDQNLIAISDREKGVAAIEYIYNNNGQKEKEWYLDTGGELALRSDIGCASLEFRYDNTGRCSGESYYGTKNEPIIRQDKGYAAVEHEYDEFGQCLSSRFFDTDGNAVISKEDHCAGYEYGYDDWGNTTDYKYIGLDGSLMIRRDLGYAWLHSVYDIEGNEREVYYYDSEGRSVISKEGGYSFCKKEFDKGNMIEAQYYDTEGNLVLRKDKGYAIVKCEYDNQSQVISEFYYDIAKQLVINTEFLCAGKKFQYDEAGNVSEVCFLGKDKEKIIHRNYGYAQIKYKNDISGNIMAVAYYDTEGKPIAQKAGGYASYEKIELEDNWVEYRYYNTKGELVICRDTGCAIIREKNDEYGQCICELYYGIDSRPIICKKYQSAGRKWEFDENGNVTKLMCLDLNGELMVRTDLGYAQICYKYDDLGQEIYVAYLDANDERVKEEECGYSFYTKEYDDEGNWIGNKYYDIEGNLTMGNDWGCAILKRSYDEYGQHVASRYYNPENELVISSVFHCAGYEYGYDENGNQIVTRYIGVDGKNMYRKDLGYAQEYCKYDCFGNKICLSYRDIDGNLVGSKDGGNASCEYFYDNRNHVIETRYYDINGNLMLLNDTGYAICKEEYDEFGERLFYHFYGLNGEEVISKLDYCAGYQYSYDNKGNLVSVLYIDPTNEPMVRKNMGCAEVRYKYDNDGNQIEWKYLDEKRRLVVEKVNGYAKSRYKYGENGKLILVSYYDAEGKLINGVDGYAIMKFDCDSAGNYLKVNYYDQNGREISR